MQQDGVVVIGSIHEDRFAYVGRLPAPGETVLAGTCELGIGGKGANQAIVAARLGAEVSLIAMVGPDAAGSVAVAELAAQAVSVEHVGRTTGTPTGQASITVDAAGENVIVVHSGANRDLTPAVVERELAQLAGDRSLIIVCQCEVPPDTVAAAAAAAGGRHRFLLNLAPCVPVDTSTLERADPLVVNRVEARQLAEQLGVARGNVEPRELAGSLRRFASSVVITLGAEGALVADGEGVELVPAGRPSAVVDTTGAGDAFVGAVAAHLAEGFCLRDAVRAGCAAGAVAVSRRGAIESYPTATELEEFTAGALHG
ncbi:ribokinase [Saccharopolyspora pogona]|uniref:ribokinase n=1 Tax=Saccharopolyspora pogona TaxID=333966 RepID=UPI001687B0E1|nr:ribokinase [Saccharopolyspora pogona]